jgi:hypothetical protein
MSNEIIKVGFQPSTHLNDYSNAVSFITASIVTKVEVEKTGEVKWTKNALQQDCGATITNKGVRLTISWDKSETDNAVLPDVGYVATINGGGYSNKKFLVEASPKAVLVGVQDTLECKLYAPDGTTFS